MVVSAIAHMSCMVMRTAGVTWRDRKILPDASCTPKWVRTMVMILSMSSVGRSVTVSIGFPDIRTKIVFGGRAAASVVRTMASASSPTGPLMGGVMEVSLA